MRKLLIISFFIICCFVLYPYAKVELLTREYGSQFVNVPRNPAWSGKVIYLKVFDYTDVSAKIYMVENNFGSNGSKYKTGTMYYFNRKNTNEPWLYNSFRTIWSEFGSADGWVYPYYGK